MKKLVLVVAALFVPVAVMVGVGQGNGSALSGQVKDGKGEALSGVVVSAKDGAGKSVTVMSQVDGTFRMADLAPGPYEVRVKRRGFVADPQKVVLVKGEGS